MRAFAFMQDTVTIGRNPECDVFLDNPGISRDHVKLTRTTRETYFLEDLGSANGTMINDVRVERAEVRENDVVQIGKFSLWMTYDMDRRSDDDPARRASPTALEGTTVLKTSELQDMIETTRQAEARFRASTGAGTAIPAPAQAGYGPMIPGAPAIAGAPPRTGPAFTALLEALPPRARIGLLAAGLVLFVLGTAVGAAASLVLSRGSHLLGR
ncbi:MAG: FHA domain-containing protein [Candidatus Eiseniibacteriota bacterium]